MTADDGLMSFGNAEWRVLILDDDPVFSDWLNGVLESQDCRVGICATLQETVEAIQKATPQILMFEPRLLGPGNLDFIGKLRVLHPLLRYIAIAANPSLDGAVDALRQGVFDYLKKPSSAEEIAAVVSRCLDTLEAARTKEDDGISLEIRNRMLAGINTRLRTAVESARILTACISLAEFYSALLEEFAKNVGAEGGSLYLRHETGLELVHSLDPSHVPIFLPFPLVENSVFDRVIREQHPILIADILNHTSTNPSGWDGYKNGSALVLPLMDNAGILRGLVSLHDKDSPPFIQHDQGLILLLASLSSEVLRALQATHALRESEGRFRAVVDTSKDAIVAFNRAGIILMFNPAAQSMFGRSEKDMIGRSLDEILSDEPRRRYREYVESYLLENGNSRFDSHKMDFSVGRLDGTSFSVEAWFSKGERDEEPFFLAVFRDVTARKQAEEAMKHAKESAEESSRLKSQFLANVSHEIRTPLNCITGFAEILLESRDLSFIYDKASTILRESQTLLQLVNDLLDLAKIEAGKLEVERIPMNLDNLLAKISNAVRYQVENKNLEFRLSVEEPTPRTILGDPLRLYQVILNLVGNAIKFTERGLVMVQVETLDRDDKKVNLKFSVVDTGIGIPKEKQDRIFLSFTQADGSTTRRYGGTGLGTTISLQLVELMGGVLGLESEPGKGSVFWFTLPAQICEGPYKDESLFAPVAVTSRTNLPTGPASFLLAEDYAPNQELVKIHLEHAGHRVTVVEDGEKAVRACMEGRFDLILMDVQMPLMDGCEATRRIRASDSPNSKIPIVGLTAHAHVSDREACIKAGMDDVLTKPIRKVPFLVMIEKWLPDVSVESPATLDEPSPVASAEETSALPFNYEEAVFEFGGNKGILDNVLRQFFNLAAKDIAQMRLHAEQQDVENLCRAAHKLRGGAANLTAMPLSRAAGALEHACEEQKMANIMELWQTMDVEFRRLKDFAQAKPGGSS